MTIAKTKVSVAGHGFKGEFVSSFPTNSLWRTLIVDKIKLNSYKIL